MKKLVVFVAGEGGHLKQFERLYELLEGGLNNVKVVLVTDEFKPIKAKHIEVIEVGSLRSKSGFHVKTAMSHMKQCVSLIKLFKSYNQITLVSTGPGIALTCALITKLCRGKVIHVETWSRFNSRSMTGRFMYYLADVFYVQNRELGTLYPKAIYSGRL